MTYSQQAWFDGADGGTPLSAERLLHIEQGIADAQTPVLATVATTGSYTDLSNTPTAYTNTDAVAAVQGVASIGPTGVWNFTQNPKVNGVPITGSGTPADATTSSKGVVQLAGDLAGTAAAPTVPNKLTAKSATTTLSAPLTDFWQKLEIIDDGSLTTSWPNRLEAAFTPSGGTRGLTFYLNEYGEVRIEPAKANTVPLRVFTKHAPGDAAHTVNTFELMDDRTTRTLLMSIDSAGNVKAANLPGRITAASSAPTSPATGDVWIDLSA